MILGEQTLRVVAADDSAVIRRVLKMLFESVAQHSGGSQAKLELCAAVEDGRHCLEAVRRLDPHLVLLDLEMPGMGGMEVLDILRRERPHLPIVMCSAYTERGAAATLEALARGAVDYITKPSGHTDPLAAMASLSAQLLPKIAALTARAQRGAAISAALVEQVALTPAKSDVSIVGIGVSTGGPMALEQMLPKLGEDFPVPVLIVQHMPKLFTRALAERLDGCCTLRVRQAEEGDVLETGTILFAPGDSHMEVARSARGAVRVVLHQDAPINHSRPSVDPLFCSIAKVYGAQALGVVMTGMGSDGLDGAQAIVKAGGMVLAQDEESSAVWGMPGRVVEAGLAQQVPLSALADALRRRTARAQAKNLQGNFAMREASYAVQ